MTPTIRRPRLVVIGLAVAALTAMSLTIDPAAWGQGARARDSATATTGYAETTGGVTNTWSDYSTAGGSQGPSIAANATVEVTCRVAGYAVSDGDTWWYEVASSPWDDTYYASADAFYNNGQTSGSLHGTPYFDPNVPICGAASDPPPPASSPPSPGASGPAGLNETTGGITHTWTDYATAGGTAGQTIPADSTVVVTCKTTGFEVSDGDTWWYEIAPSPWNDAYFASADAFFNNGQTSGSLVGTPLVDANVPTCAGSAPGPVRVMTPKSTPRSTALVPAPRHEHVHAVVLISWHWRGRHTQLRSLSLPHFPSNATISFACSGPGCPRGTLSAKARQLSVLRWLSQRTFRVGDTIRITIRVPGMIPERALLTIEDGGKPRARLL